MKRILIIGISLLIIGISLIQSSQKTDEDISLNFLTTINTASAVENDTGDCCNRLIFWKTCNKRIESIIAPCYAFVTRREYVGTNGGIVGVAIVTGGTINLKWGYSTGSYNDSQVSTSYQATRVNCPTDGQCNNCEEYNPC